MNKQPNVERQQGHWVLAKMGKRVLRPGGRELTEKMIAKLNIGNSDKVVEFAPGLGITAQITLAKNPQTYTGVELNEDAAAQLRQSIHGEGREIRIGNASDSGLESDSYDKVYGEAMLTMQSAKRKQAIVQEAHRLLKTGGLYGIHELGLKPDDVDESVKKSINQALASVIKVDARPLTESEWCEVLESQGFKVLAVETNPMHLLEPKRVLQDEGLFRTLKILFNVLTHPKARKRIMTMRRTFRVHRQHLQAVAIVAEKT